MYQPHKKGDGTYTRNKKHDGVREEQWRLRDRCTAERIALAIGLFFSAGEGPRRAAPALNQLILTMEGYIHRIAHGFRHHHGLNEAEYDDIIAEGRLGAWAAVEKFDPNRISKHTGERVPFASFAAWRIWHGINIWIKHNTHIVWLPINVRNHIKEELAAVEKGSMDWAILSNIFNGHMVYLDEPTKSSDQCQTRLDKMEQPPLDDETAFEPHQVECVRKAIALLPERERWVVEERLAGKTLGEIGQSAKSLNKHSKPVSRERVRQLYQRALGKIRERLGLNVDTR